MTDTRVRTPLEQALSAEFDGKSKDHVVTAESNPVLMALFIEAALGEASQSATPESSGQDDGAINESDTAQ